MSAGGMSAYYDTISKTSFQSLLSAFSYPSLKTLSNLEHTSKCHAKQMKDI